MQTLKRCLQVLAQVGPVGLVGLCGDIERPGLHLLEGRPDDDLVLLGAVTGGRVEVIDAFLVSIKDQFGHAVYVVRFGETHGPEADY